MILRLPASFDAVGPARPAPRANRPASGRNAARVKALQLPQTVLLWCYDDEADRSHGKTLYAIANLVGVRHCTDAHIPHIESFQMHLWRDFKRSSGSSNGSYVKWNRVGLDKGLVVAHFGYLECTF
jgi:hypothetical protein